MKYPLRAAGWAEPVPCIGLDGGDGVRAGSAAGREDHGERSCGAYERTLGGLVAELREVILTTRPRADAELIERACEAAARQVQQRSAVRQAGRGAQRSQRDRR